MPKIHAGDIDLYYEITGTGPPLLFIHGLGSSSTDWEFQVDFFAQSFQVITVDLRGHGKSAKPAGPYSIELFARDLAALLKAMEIAPVHAVGISLGGMVGLQMAIDTPDLLKSLCLVNTEADFRLRTMGELLQFFKRLLIVHLLGMRGIGKFLGRRLFPKPEQAGLRDTFVRRWAANDKQAYLSAFKALSGWSVLDRLDSVQCPVLVVAAAEDYTPLARKKAYTEMLARAELVIIPDSRHATPADQPKIFNRILMEFLKKQQ